MSERSLAKPDGDGGGGGQVVTEVADAAIEVVRLIKDRTQRVMLHHEQRCLWNGWGLFGEGGDVGKMFSYNA